MRIQEEDKQVTGTMPMPIEKSSSVSSVEGMVESSMGYYNMRLAKTNAIITG